MSALEHTQVSCLSRRQLYHTDDCTVDSTLALIEAMTKSDAALADIVGPLLHVLRNADTGLVGGLFLDYKWHLS